MKAPSSPPAPPPALALNAALRRAGTLFRARRYLEAAQAYREVIQRHPKLADVHNNLGVTLKAAGHLSDAIPCFKRAVRLKPDYVAALGNLAGAFEAVGQIANAVDPRIDAWRLDPENVEIRDALIRTLRRCSYEKPHPGARAAIAALQAHPDVDQQALSDPAIRIWSSHPGIRRTLEAAQHGFPDDPPGAGFKSLTGFLPDDLVIRALCWSIVSHPAMEAWLTRTRRFLLDAAIAGQPVATDSRWLAAIAVQARASEWVWFETPEEQDQLIRLADLALIDAPPPNRALIRAMYMPIETDPAIESLWHEAGALKADDRSPYAVLLRRSLVEPRSERQIAGDLTHLTDVRDTVSKAVRDQYEDSPYPRWLSLARRPRTTLLRHLAQVLALPDPVRAEDERPRILIAGCGTGRHALQTALRYENAEVFAIDLSVASLAYGRRMALELGVGNIIFAQADLLEIGGYPERFNLIESSGVLHHLDDPMAGWRVLRRLLAPGGLMRLAFYSRRARIPLDDVRNAVPARGDLMTRVRAARRRIYGLPEGHAARALLRSADFYAASGVRDALLHTREVTVDPPWIKQALGDLELRFLGFELPDPAMLDAYRKRNPADRSGVDLDAWNAMEIDHPDMFLGMYQFWAQANAASELLAANTARP